MAPSDAEVLIVGAGMAGLTAAIALDRMGVEVLVLERAARLAEAGTALSLWPNALAALDHIGLGAAVRAIGVTEPAGIVSGPSGKVILVLDQSRLGPGTAARIVLRPALQHLLLESASHLEIQPATPAREIGSDGDGGFVELESGAVLRAPLVLACDGVHSVGRAFVGNPPPEFRGRTSWRAVLEGCAPLVSGARLTVGGGRQFVMSPMPDGLVYWAADVGLPEGANATMEDRRGFLLAAFSGWHEPIAQLIGRTLEEELVIADLYDSVPRRLTRGAVALLGDAGHPMTPDLGQGACQAIEDAVVLAACLDRELRPDRALARYETIRLRRTGLVVRESRRLGRLATTRSPLATAIRDITGRLLPDRLNARLMARYAGEAGFRRQLDAAMS